MPALFSIVFGSVVLGGILQDTSPASASAPDTSGGTLEIVGLAGQYAVSEPVTVRVAVSDGSFDCGDLYVTIYSGDGSAVTQEGYFEQCFGAQEGVIPVGGEFSYAVDSAGSYEIVADMISPQLERASVTERFTVK